MWRHSTGLTWLFFTVAYFAIVRDAQMRFQVDKAQTNNACNWYFGRDMQCTAIGALIITIHDLTSIPIPFETRNLKRSDPTEQYSERTLNIPCSGSAIVTRTTVSAPQSAYVAITSTLTHYVLYAVLSKWKITAHTGALCMNLGLTKSRTF